MSTRITIRTLEIVAFGWLFLSHFALCFFGLAFSCFFLLSGFIPNLRGSLLMTLLTVVPAFCLSLGWCVYRVRNRTICKNVLYFICVFLKAWLLWLFFFLIVTLSLSDVNPSVKALFLRLPDLFVWSYVLVALCLSIGWLCYSFRKGYLAIAEYPTKDFMEFPQKFLAFFVITATKRS